MSSVSVILCPSCHSIFPTLLLAIYFSLHHPIHLVPSCLLQSRDLFFLPLPLLISSLHLFFTLSLFFVCFSLPPSFPLFLSLFLYPPSRSPSVGGRALSVTVGLFVYQLQGRVFAKSEITEDETMWLSCFAHIPCLPLSFVHYLS